MQVQRPLFCFETSKTGQCSCTDTPTTRPGLTCSDATPASDVVFAFPSRMCSWLPVAVTRARLQMTRAAAATNPTASSRTSPATGKTAKKFKSSSRFRTSQCNVRWVAACLFRTSREGCICHTLGVLTASSTRRLSWRHVLRAGFIMADSPPCHMTVWGGGVNRVKSRPHWHAKSTLKLEISWRICNRIQCPPSRFNIWTKPLPHNRAVLMVDVHVLLRKSKIYLAGQ